MLAAMQRLLAQNRNFGSLSVEELCNEAGMSRGTFYLHFRDKNELVTRLIEYLTGELVRGMGNWGLGLEWADKGDVDQAVSGVVRCFYENRAIVIAIRDTMNGNDEIRQLYDNMIMEISSRAQESVRKVIKRGDARNGVTPGLGNALTWIVSLYSNDLVNSADESAIDEAIKYLQHMCVAAIFKD